MIWDILGEFVFALVFDHRSHVARNGMIIRRETCDGCRRTFFYFQRRSVTALPERVEGRLERELRQSADVVACPSCGGITAAMVRSARRDRVVSVLGAAVVAGPLAVITAAFGGAPADSAIRVGLWAAGGVVAAGLVLARVCRVSSNVDRGSIDAESVVLPAEVRPYEREMLIAGKAVIRRSGGRSLLGIL